MEILIARNKVLLSIFVVILALLASGCVSVKLIADYDEQTDKAVTALQRRMETFFIELEGKIGSDAANFDSNRSFYDGVRVDISAIKLRAAAIPKNEITLEQVSLLENNLQLMIDVHKEGIGSIELIQVARDDFNTALRNILALELAKKRGE